MSGYYGHRQPEDVPLVPGDSAQVRAAVAALRSSQAAISQARDAAVALDSILSGDLWQGEAFACFVKLVNRKPLVDAADNARTAMENAAGALEVFAELHASHQGDLYYWRGRLAEIGAPPWPAPVPEEAVPQLELVDARVREIHERHDSSENAVHAVFNDLDDKPMFAEPPPSSFDRVRGAAGDVVNFGTELFAGVLEGVGALVDTAVLIVNPNTWRQAWNHRAEILAVVKYAVDNPGEFAFELGKAIIDVDLLLSNPARWMGQRVPDLLLAFGTMGTGTALGVGAKFARAGSKVDSVADGLRMTERVTDNVVGIGKSADTLASINGGAGVRLDTISGRLAHRFDKISPRLANARRAPGDAHDTVKHAVKTRLERGAKQYNGPAKPAVQRILTSKTLASKLTEAIPGVSQAKRLDALLTGAPAVADKVDRITRSVNGLHHLDNIRDRLGHAESAHQIATQERSRYAPC